MKRILSRALLTVVMLFTLMLPQIQHVTRMSASYLSAAQATSSNASRLMEPQPGELLGIAVASGVKLSWAPVPGVIGYRIYRSTQLGDEGISVTEFPMNITEFVDVNVDADTIYYYSLRTVLMEANIVGGREQRGEPTAQIMLKTSSDILGGSASENSDKVKNVILMKLDDPIMSLNGMHWEIDLGRGTAPQLINGRTFMPIRAVIEAMNGKIGWEEASSTITLEADGHNVTMWLNRKELLVDGESKEMNVAPLSLNGRTMVPLRFAAENLGCVVDWISSTNEIAVVFYTLW